MSCFKVVFSWHTPPSPPPVVANHVTVSEFVNNVLPTHRKVTYCYIWVSRVGQYF
jgi:hypothetical protein